MPFRLRLATFPGGIQQSREQPEVAPDRGQQRTADRGYADPRDAGELKPKSTSLAAALKAHLGRAHAGDYVATLAYIERSPAHIATLALNWRNCSGSAMCR